MNLKAGMKLSRVIAPVREQVVSNLRQALIDEDFAPGERLVERSLCDMTGASRPVIREALRQLESEGFVTVLPNKGAIATVVTHEDAEAIYEVRAVLEGLAARLFVRRATPEERDALASAVRRLEAATAQASSEGLLEAKTLFYEVLLSGAGNEVISSVLRGLHGRVTKLRARSMSTSGRPGESLKEVTDILDAILRRDEDAAWKASVIHIERAARLAIGHRPETETL